MKDDTISRSAAIDAVECITSSMSVCLNEDECHGMKRMQRQAILELANMPSAQPEPSQVARDIATIIENEKDMRVIASTQPERKKGEWIDYTEDGYVECPFCHSATNCDGNKDELHFCFSCGADMRGE